MFKTYDSVLSSVIMSLDETYEQFPSENKRFSTW